MFEKADDLEVCRLHIWADHFDGKRDAKWLGGEDVFLWRGRGVGSRGVDHQCGADDTEKMEFVFHTRNEITRSYDDLTPLTPVELGVLVSGDRSYAASRRVSVASGFLGHNLRFLSGLRCVVDHRVGVFNANAISACLGSEEFHKRVV